MPVHQYDPYVNRSAGTIAEMMQAPARARAQAALQAGEAQARAAEQSGAGWANAVGSIGSMISAVPGQLQQQKRLAQQDRMQAMQLRGMQGEEAAAQREAMEDQALRSIFSGGEPKPEAIYQVVGPQRGAAILKGMAALKTENQKAYDSTQTIVRDVLDGLNAAPEPLRASAWTGTRENLIGRGIIKPEDAPEQYDPVWFEQARSYGRQPKEAKAPEPFTLGEGQQRYDAAGKLVASGPAKPEPREANATEAQLALIAARGGPEGAQATKALGLLRAQHPKTPKVPTDKDGLVAAVIANPSLFDQLTPSEKGRIAPALHEQGYGDFGKPIPPAAAKLIGESKSAVDGLRDLRQVVKENEQYMGPIAGLSALNPYSDAKKAQAKIDLVRQRVGKALEGGVLRKEDEEKYKIILAGMRDTPALAMSKLDFLIENVERDITNYTNELRLSGRRVNTDAAGRTEAPTKPGTPPKAARKNPF